MPRMADPSSPLLPAPGILGEAPVLHHGHGLHGGLDPHLRQPHQPGRMPAARQGRGGQRKQEQASLSRKQPGARRARPCQRGCSCRNLRRLKSYILPLAAHSSRPHLPTTLAQTSEQGSWPRLPLAVSSLAPKSPLEGLYIPSKSSGTTPTRPSHSPLMMHLLAPDPQERDETDLLTGDPAVQGGCCHGPGALRMDVAGDRR